MHTVVSVLFTLLRAVVKPRATPMLENAALRRQLAIVPAQREVVAYYKSDAFKPGARALGLGRNLLEYMG